MPRVRLVDIARARIGEQRLDALTRAVGRAIVDHDQLEIPVGLSEHRRDRFADEALGGGGRKDYGYEFAHGINPSRGAQVVWRRPRQNLKAACAAATLTSKK